MRQIEIREWTTPEQLTVTQGPVPLCGPGQIRIRVKAVAITHSLWLLIQGKYQRKPAFPFIPGSFVSGVVVERGEGATRFAIGDRVMASLELGGLAEEAIAWEASSYAMVPSMSFAQANAINASYSSTMAALTWPRLLDVQKGDWLLVTGASGAVGVAAVEMGRILGATVIGTATTEAKRNWVLDRGAHHVLPSDAAGLRDRVMALTGNESVHAVLDPVGGDVFKEALRCLRPDGRIVPLGFAGGTIPEIAANLILVKNITVGGLNMGYYKLTQRLRYEAQIRAMFEQMGNWFQAGAIKPVVGATFAPERVSDAFAAVLKRDQFGHIAVVFDDQ